MKHSVPDGVPNASRALERLKPIWGGYWPSSDPDVIAAEVSERLASAIEAWELTEIVPIGEGNVALVCVASCRGSGVVVKVNPCVEAERRELAAEAAGLEFWRATGAVVALLDARDDGLTVLLDRLDPGDPLDRSGLTWERQLVELGRLAARLHSAGSPPASLPDLLARAPMALEIGADPELGAELGALVAETRVEVLTHLDLHGGNALRDGDRWLAIDPKPTRADPHADIWALVSPQAPALPSNRGAAASIANRWLETYCAAAGLEADRARRWTRLRARATAGDSGAGSDWERGLLRLAEALA